MTEEGHILDVPLPLCQDFNALKDRALAYVQEHTNYQWTNLNASDPGVTILDQLCYALTELGYCGDFSMQDILAGKDGTLRVEDQFYLPENILTTSPVTFNDYKKYVIDGVANADNAIFLRGSNNQDVPVASFYYTYLLIDPAVDQGEQVTGQNPRDYVCKAAFVYLNKARNLCEIFTLPVPLVTKACDLLGTIEIESTEELGNILQLINSAISQYIFAPVVPKSYQQLVAGSETMDAIFDGPRLKNGWISTEMLGKKKDMITIYEIIQLIEIIPGVLSVPELYFAGNKEKLYCEPNELLVINATISYADKSLVFTCNDATIDPGTFVLTSTTTNTGPGFESNILFGAGVDIRKDLPQARYRDINSYYSIQNTFPDIYAVGSESIISNATEFQIAQSRQLKGYLTLFDQVLANQFSQLANVERLFAFTNSMTGTPSDTHWYYAVQDKYQKTKPRYPVPYLRFSPTYFYQSLYNIPDIQPLLKGNDKFNFSLKPESPQVMEKKEWHQFRHDPYNPYIHGLMNIMEEEPDSLYRRNKMLDHLLARHGESPALINAYIDGSSYTNERIKDQVIFKSLYLQNLGLLSYNRYKAYNYLEADRFVKKLKEIQFDEHESTRVLRKEFEHRILVNITLEEKLALRELINEHSALHSLPLMEWILAGNTIDSVFNSKKVDAVEKVTERDIRNYSGIELKLNLLFGLKALYRDLLVTGDKKVCTPDGPVFVPTYSNLEKLQALWLISKRKGFIMVEMTLLLACLEFDLFFKVDTGGTEWSTLEPLDYDQAAALMNTFLNNSSEDNQVTFHPQLTDLSKPTELEIAEVFYGMKPLASTSAFKNPYQPIPGTLFSFALNARYAKQTIQTQGTSQSELTDEVQNISFAQIAGMTTGPLFIFPGYVPMFQSYSFYTRLKFFLDNELPVNTVYGLKYSGADLLDGLIPAFCAWHDSLIYDSLDTYSLSHSSKQAGYLLSLIAQTSLLPYHAA